MKRSSLISLLLSVGLVAIFPGKARANLVREVGGSIVAIDNVNYAGGTGVIIASNKNQYVVLTAQHVVKGEQPRRQIITDYGTFNVVNQKCLLPERGEPDICTLIFESQSQHPVVNLGSLPDDAISKSVCISGYFRFEGKPAEKPGLYTAQGTISSSPSKAKIITYNLATGREMSGSPIFDRHLNVIAIHTGRSSLGDYKKGVNIDAFFENINKFGLDNFNISRGPGNSSRKSCLENPSFQDLANEAYSRNDFRGAIKYLTDSIRSNPKLAEAYFKRGASYGELGQWNSAIRDYGKALSINSDIYEAYYNRGLLRGRELGDFKSAVLDFNQAIKLEPNDPDIYAQRGNVWLSQGKYNKAIEDYNISIKQNPRHGEAWFNRGIAYEQSNRSHEALESYQQAAQIFRLAGQEADYSNTLQIIRELQSVR